METIVDEIAQAVDRLGLNSVAMRLLPPQENDEVFRTALKHFVASSGRRWWWEDFRSPGKSLYFNEGDGWKQLPRIAPAPNESIWFIAEDDSLSHYPVFETTPEVASLVIGQCYGFEYYLVAKDLSWLICETHHNVICAVGEVVESRLHNGF